MFNPNPPSTMCLTLIHHVSKNHLYLPTSSPLLLSGFENLSNGYGIETLPYDTPPTRHAVLFTCKQTDTAGSDKEIIGQTTMRSREDTAEAIRPSTPVIEYQIEIPHESSGSRRFCQHAMRTRLPCGHYLPTLFFLRS